jgi:hypothetical protein
MPHMALSDSLDSFTASNRARSADSPIRKPKQLRQRNPKALSSKEQQFLDLLKNQTSWCSWSKYSAQVKKNTANRKVSERERRIIHDSPARKMLHERSLSTPPAFGSATARLHDVDLIERATQPAPSDYQPEHGYSTLSTRGQAFSLAKPKSACEWRIFPFDNVTKLICLLFYSGLDYLPREPETQPCVLQA